MPESSVFVQDNPVVISVRDRNMQLGTELSAGVNSTRRIVRIVRVDGGWRIYYEA